jgi:hypothetical protein
VSAERESLAPSLVEDSTYDGFSWDEMNELRGVWLSCLMFNRFVGFAPETRSFEEFLESHRG